MTAAEIEPRLIAQLAMLLDSDVEAIAGDSSLQSLGVDSMRFVELFIYIENEFGVELMATDMQRSDLETPQAMAASIARNL